LNILLFYFFHLKNEIVDDSALLTPYYLHDCDFLKKFCKWFLFVFWEFFLSSKKKNWDTLNMITLKYDLGRWFSPGTPASSTNKTVPRYNWNIVKSGIKHRQTKFYWSWAGGPVLILRTAYICVLGISLNIFMQPPLYCRLSYKYFQDIFFSTFVFC
jgi:hypothetical protein